MAVQPPRLCICLCLLIITAPAVCAQGPSKNLAEIFAPVDEGQRQRLAERLRAFVECHRDQRWDKAYDLTYKPYLEELKVETREEFVRSKRKYESGPGGRSYVFGFVPHVTTAGKGAARHYFIQGCVGVRWGGSSGYTWGGVLAYLVDGEWVFTGIGVEVEAHNPLPTCGGEGRADGLVTRVRI